MTNEQKLREALKFYAEDANYARHYDKYGNSLSAIDSDNGNIAREALSQPTSDEGTPVADLVSALFSRSQTFSTERHEAIEQVERLERTLHAKERELADAEENLPTTHTVK